MTTIRFTKSNRKSRKIRKGRGDKPGTQQNLENCQRHWDYFNQKRCKQKFDNSPSSRPRHKVIKYPGLIEKNLGIKPSLNNRTLQRNRY
jgi:hypothetical protein